MPMVSIIVPVYNAGKTLSRCMDSILNQEYEDFELLAIDDGSTDDSAAILDGYAARDARVRVVHKENTGVSDSRNRAMDLAEGNYLQFLDADDWITPDATRLLVHAAETGGCELVIADFYRVSGERVARKGDIQEGGVLTREQFVSHMVENPADFYYGVVWNKLYRRQIAGEYGIRMNGGMQWCEDFLFNLDYILHTKTVYVLQTPVYYYVRTPGSLVSQNSTPAGTIRMKTTVFAYYQNMYRSVFDEKEYQKNRLQIYKFLIDAAGDNHVPPTILPGACRLGEERVRIRPDALTARGAWFDEYRAIRLYEYYMQNAASQNGLTLQDVRILTAVDQLGGVTKRELTDLLGPTGRNVMRSVRKLEKKKILYVSQETDVILPGEESGGILGDIWEAGRDYEEARFAGLTREEKDEYRRLEEKILRARAKIYGKNNISPKK